MTLDILIQEILGDNKSRTALELHDEIISSKKYFFEVLKPESAVKRTCNNLYKKGQVNREKKKNRWYYSVSNVSEELDRDIKETINVDMDVIQQDTVVEDIKTIVEEVIVEVENKKSPEKMMTMNSVLLFVILASGIYFWFK